MPQMVQINHHPIAQDTHHIRMQNARGQQIEYIGSRVGHYGVSRIAAALVTYYYIRLFRQQIHDASFSFIAPVNTCHRRQHGPFLLYLTQLI